MEEAEGSCTVEVTSVATVAELRSFVERAVLTGGFLLTSNRSEGETVVVGFRGAGVTGEATIDPGPPAALRWTLAAD